MLGKCLCHLRQVLCPVPPLVSIPGISFLGTAGPLVPGTCSCPALCAERSKGQPGTPPFLQKPVQHHSCHHLPSELVPALSHQPPGNVATKELLGGANAVVSRRCLPDSTLHKTQTRIVPLSSAVGIYHLFFSLKYLRENPCCSPLFWPRLS